MTESKWDWVEVVTRLAGAVGMNPVRTRWKLMQWKESWGQSKQRAANKVEEVRYRHKVCPFCGVLQDDSRRTCLNCGKVLLPHWLEVLKRFGLGLPQIQSVSTFLSALMGLIFLRMVASQGLDGLMGFNTETLIRYGAHCREFSEAGQPWRIATAILLHAGLVHIFFNLFALMQVGPIIEQVFGRGRMLFIFMVTGILGNIGSELAMNSLAIGASGAIMGLCGAAAGWGHRDGSYMGVNIRNQMVKWTVYTVLFGLFIHADNAAHVVGFVTGAVFGYFYKPQFGQAARSFFYWVETAVGGLLLAATVALVFIASSLQ